MTNTTPVLRAKHIRQQPVTPVFVPPDHRWAKATISLANLRRRAFIHRSTRSVFEFLKAIGLVPRYVTQLKTVLVRVDADPEALNVGYLAASAFEWDSWGESSPVDFINALTMETKGAPQHDLVSDTLTLLGRERAEEAA